MSWQFHTKLLYHYYTTPLHGEHWIDPSVDFTLEEAQANGIYLDGGSS